MYRIAYAEPTCEILSFALAPLAEHLALWGDETATTTTAHRADQQRALDAAPRKLGHGIVLGLGVPRYGCQGRRVRSGLDGIQVQLDVGHPVHKDVVVLAHKVLLVLRGQHELERHVPIVVLPLHVHDLERRGLVNHNVEEGVLIHGRVAALQPRRGAR